MKPVKLTPPQLRTLRRICSGKYFPRPTPSTHKNATFMALQRKGAITAEKIVVARPTRPHSDLCESHTFKQVHFWLPGPLAGEFLAHRGHLKDMDKEE